MKKVILIAITLVAILVVGCSKAEVTATPDTPEGAIKAYFQALKLEKFEQAYTYVKTDKTKEQWIEDKKSSPMNYKDFTVNEAQVEGNTATGTVVFETNVAEMPQISLNAQLEKDGDKWYITSLGMDMPGGTGMPTAGEPVVDEPDLDKIQANEPNTEEK